MKRSKGYRATAEQIDPDTAYAPREAVRIAVLFEDYKMVRLERRAEELVVEVLRLRASGGGEFSEMLDDRIAVAGLGEIMRDHLQVGMSHQ